MAKVTYTKKGSDPSSIQWPPRGAASDVFTFSDGVQVTLPLIANGDGSLTYPDGRLFPPMTAAGSTFTHNK